VILESKLAGVENQLIGAVWSRRRFIAMNSTGKVGEYPSIAEAEEAVIAAATKPTR